MEDIKKKMSLLIKKRFLIHKKNLIYYIGNFFLYLFFTFNFISFGMYSSLFISRIRFLVLIIAAIFGYYYLLKKHNNNLYFVFLIFVISWTFATLFREKGVYSFDLFKYSLMYMGVSLNILYSKQNFTIAKFLFFVCCTITLFQLLILKIPIRQFMRDGTSYNYISVLVLFYLLFYNVVCIQNKKNYDFLAAILFFIISLISYGRGGIITAGFYLIMVFIYKFSDIKLFYKCVLCIIMIVFLSLSVNSIREFIYNSGLFDKFIVRAGEEESRLLIWKIYITDACSSVKSFFWGGNKYLINSEGNIHNSFLQMHSSIGIIPLLITVYSYARLTLQAFIKKNYLLVISVITLIIRAFTDKLFFQGFNEIFLYYFIFYFCYKKGNFDE